MAIPLIQYLEEAASRDSKPDKTCATCGEPLLSGEPLGPYRFSTPPSEVSIEAPSTSADKKSEPN